MLLEGANSALLLQCVAKPPTTEPHWC